MGAIYSLFILYFTQDEKGRIGITVTINVTKKFNEILKMPQKKFNEVKSVLKVLYVNQCLIFGINFELRNYKFL